MSFVIHFVDNREPESVAENFIHTYIALIDKRTVDHIIYPNGEIENNQDKYGEDL